ncbi:MAG: 4-alpha-glucanotransferase [Myxococcales bacterium]|nr:4-alpha-glucanotransferase [Myxococcales bacterium]
MTGSPSWERPAHQAAVGEALQALGIHRLVLSIHDASFPAGADDVGRGTPYSDAGRAFLSFVRAVGFTGVQLGPQGLTTRENPSPYDAMMFSREPLSIAVGPLLGREKLRALVGDVPWTTARHSDHKGAYDRQYAALGALWQARRDDSGHEAEAWARAQGPWLDRDGALDAMPLEQYRFVQWVAHRQHEELRRFVVGQELRLYGDLQIGISWRDRQSLAGLFLAGYAMGAPPSRTNPEGQPWGYPVLDPAQYEGAAGALVAARVDKMLDEYDGLRVDHPHGLVDPWVYRADSRDPGAAVRAGARLFSSPDLSDHPSLARFAVARPDQLDRSEVRWADGWVRDLDDAQVDRYAVLFARVVGRLRARGHRLEDLLCEVLSTWPHPLRRVMEREGLGRMCVTQKANLDDARDVYRSDNARNCDWIMVGNHDTPPLWALCDQWHGTPTAARRAQHLAERLEPDASSRASFAASLASSPGRLATAMFAELFASPARSVSIFFADLLGYRETYNAPGTVGDQNWSLRVAPDWSAEYGRAIGTGENPRALSVPRALALALRADPQRARVHESLLLRLDALADEH